jgi:hypothetical protein
MALGFRLRPLGWGRSAAIDAAARPFSAPLLRPLRRAIGPPLLRRVLRRQPLIAAPLLLAIAGLVVRRLLLGMGMAGVLPLPLLLLPLRLVTLLALVMRPLLGLRLVRLLRLPPHRRREPLNQEAGSRAGGRRLACNVLRAARRSRRASRRLPPAGEGSCLCCLLHLLDHLC